MKRRWAVVWLLLAMLATPAFAQTRAWLDRTQIHAGETVVLTIETDQAIQQIDDAPLQGQFEIGGHNMRQRIALRDGRMQRNSVFAIGLRPRGLGTLTVPALRVGSALTAPLSLQVMPAQVQPATATSDVFVETVVDATQPYVQQAVGVTVRLHYAVPLLSGQLDLDAPANASVQRVGEDATYPRDIGGRHFNVVERRYLLIPERSGSLVLPGARLNGVAAGGTIDQVMDGDRRPLSAAAPAQRLQVQPIPANAPLPWLPLHALTLRYLEQPKSAVSGQAVNVVIELLADGATAAQVPAITLDAPAAVQVFAEPPQVEEQFVEGRPRTWVRRKFALLPAQAGDVVIAGPHIAWWDAVQGRARSASLPPLALHVAAAAGSPGNAKPTATRPVLRSHAPATPAPATPARDGVRGWWFLALVPVLLIGVWRWRAARHPQPPSTSTPAAPQLPQALQQADLAMIAQALCHAAGQPDGDLDAVLAHLASAAQRDAVRQLQAARWGGKETAATLAALRQAFAAGPQWQPTQQRAQSLLPALYPE